MGTSVSPTVSANSAGVVDQVSVTSIKTMVNGDTIFTVVGDIQIMQLVSECVTANDATASTIQYNVVPTVGTATTISGASTTLASVTAGTIVTLVGDAFATAPIISTTGVGLAQTARGVWCPDGTIKLVMGVGSTTGTWKHYIRYKSLQNGAYVNAS